MAIQAGEIKKKIIWDTGGYNIAGFTVTMVVIDYSGARQSLAMSVDAGNLTASRLTTSSDFAIAGECKIQFVANDGTHTFKSQQITASIGPAL